jgi:hypothetical protein
VTVNSSTGVNFNRYWYANNNPYKFIDPDGRIGCAVSRIASVCASHGMVSTSVRSPLDTGARIGSGSASGSSVRSSPSIKYNAPAPRTVPVSGDNATALQCTVNCAGATSVLVTGGAEQSGHSRNSLHYQDKAVDIPGRPFNNLNHTDVMRCARSCGYTNGWWEVKGSSVKDHWHLQIGEGSRVPVIPGVPKISIPNTVEGSRTYYDGYQDKLQLDALRSR